jgi:hypothetical protein
LQKKGLGGMGGPQNWDPVVDTLLKPTNAFGEIFFDESRRQAKVFNFTVSLFYTFYELRFNSYLFSTSEWLNIPTRSSLWSFL